MIVRRRFFVLILFDADLNHLKNEEQQQPQSLSDDPTLESTPNTLVNEEDLKAGYAVDSPVCLVYKYHVFHSSIIVKVLLLESISMKVPDVKSLTFSARGS